MFTTLFEYCPNKGYFRIYDLCFDERFLYYDIPIASAFHNSNLINHLQLGTRLMAEIDQAGFIIVEKKSTKLPCSLKMALVMSLDGELVSSYFIRRKPPWLILPRF